MAKKGGVFQALGNLWRWTIWGLAAILVVALWLGWSNRTDGPDADVVADTPVTDEVPATVEDTAETVGEAVTETAEETPQSDSAAEVEQVLDKAQEAVEQAGDAASQAAGAASEAAENAVDEVRSALEGALSSAGEVARDAEGAVSNLADQAGRAAEQVEGALEGGTNSSDVPATELGEVAVVEGAIDDTQADLNILPPELSNITVPGDDASYSLVSVFQHDDGTIEVVSDRTENGETVQTIRLVTCAPLAVGVISEGGGPRDEAPKLERVPLGSAAATIAALACGAMN